MSKIKIQGSATGTGILTIQAPTTSTDRTMTIPDSDGTLLTTTGDGSSLTGVGVDGIVSTANATAITIDSSEHVSLAHGIGFNGDTAAANALDDYEEGTWTPTFGTSPSATTYNTTYTKIGRLVHITGYFSGLTSFPTSNLNIGGLPFSGNADYQMAQVWYNASIAVDALVYLPGNSTSLTLRPVNGNPSNFTELSVQMTYITNQ